MTRYQYSLYLMVCGLSHVIAFLSVSTTLAVCRGRWMIQADKCCIRQQVPSSAVHSLRAVGFGRGGERVKPPGADDAKQALRSCGGDINRATALVFNKRLSLLEEQDKELAEKIKQLYAPGASRSDPSTRNEAVHEALVSATWDAVAIMNALPSRKTIAEEREEKRIGKNLEQIANAARLPPAPQPPPGGQQLELDTATILDVGCGDGTLMPYLLEEALDKVKKRKKKKMTATTSAHTVTHDSGEPIASEDVPRPQTETESQSQGALLGVAVSKVTGVDLSPVMIQAARRKYKSRWLVGNLFSLNTLLRKDTPEPVFTSAIFNGSLQFFLEPAKALAEASAWLVEGGHIVVSHVQGSDFVEDECRRNPRVAPSPIPLREGMEAIAAEAGLTLLEGRDDESQREFLLYVMRKQ